MSHARVGIAGVSSVLSTVIDYLGHRLLAQSVIPGVLSGAGGARLVYGVMEFNKRLSVSSLTSYHYTR